MTDRERFLYWFRSKFSGEDPGAVNGVFAWEAWQAALATQSRQQEPVAWPDPNEFAAAFSKACEKAAKRPAQPADVYERAAQRFQNPNARYVDPPEDLRDLNAQPAERVLMVRPIDGHYWTVAGKAAVDGYRAEGYEYAWFVREC